jgi:hypothetical protein
LLVLTLFPLIRVQINLRHAALAGFLMGLGCLVRFDIALAALMLGFFLAGRAWWAGQTSAALTLSGTFFVAMFVALSPWMFYCQTRFGAPLASDNTRQLHVASRGHVMNYYEHPPASDLKQHPISWVVGFVTKKSPIVFNQLLSGLIGSCLPWLVGIVLFLWKGGPIKLIIEKSVFARVSLPLIPWLVIPPFLVGYARERYFIPAFMILAIVLVCFIHALQPEFWARRRAVLLSLIVVLFPAYNEGLRPLFSVNLRDLKGALAPLTPTESMNKLTQAVSLDSGSNPHFVLQVDNNDNTKYGALTGEPTIALPTIVEGSFASFVRDWQVTHAYDPDDRLVNKLHEIGSEGVELIPLELPGLYRLKRTETNP